MSWTSLLGLAGSGATAGATGLASSNGGSNWMSSLMGAGSSAGSSGGFWSGVGNLVGGLFGGGSSGSNSGSSGMSSNIFASMLGGLAGMSDAKMQQARTKEEHGFNMEQLGKQGLEQRRTVGYTADMEDFYNQKNKVRKRAALDTYGQFSLLDRYAPGRTAAPPLDAPTRPQA